MIVRYCLKNIFNKNKLTNPYNAAINEGMVVYACNLSTLNSEAGGPQV